jgi:hypothetical protein
MLFLKIGVWAAFTLHFLVRDNLMDHIGELMDTKRANVVPLVVFYLVYMALSIMTYVAVDGHLTPDSPEMADIIANFEKSCGKINMSYALQGGCLKACFYITLPVVAYLAFVLKPNEIAECSPLKKLLVLVPFSYLLSIPALFIKPDSVEN